ncbi:DUF1049 domain-containing protein [bacterium]|nr:DUF1049 domain-containing protein [bacterium]
MGKAKVYAALTLLLLVLVVIFQNRVPVETKFLFITFTMPRAALLALTLLSGAIAGMLLALGLMRRKA